MSVPALRFNGFTDSWVETKLGEITSKVGSGSTPRGGVEVYQSTGIPFIRSQNVNNEQLLLNDITFISDEINNQMKGSSVKPNDILLNITGASIGRSCVVPTDFEVGNVNQHVCIIRLKSEYSPRFLQPYLSSSRGQKSISSTQVGGGREGLNFQAIRSFNVFTPKLQEQTKIANFLKAVDEKITQLSQKHDLLTQYKKGVMQQIFSQELRFKDDDGGEFPEWEDATLGEIGKFKSGTGFSDSEQGGTSGIPFYKVSDMNLVENKLEMLVANNYVSEDQIKKMKYKVISDEAIVFAKVGAAIFLERKRKAKNFLIDNNMMAFIPECQINFIKHFMDSIRLSKFAQVGALPSYNASDLSIIEILLPCIQEQTKLANFLSVIDDKITATQTQLIALKQYKQGLLQQMFV